LKKRCQKSHEKRTKNFSSNLVEILGKIFRTSKNLPAPTPVHFTFPFEIRNADAPEMKRLHQTVLFFLLLPCQSTPSKQYLVFTLIQIAILFTWLFRTLVL